MVFEHYFRICSAIFLRFTAKLKIMIQTIWYTGPFSKTIRDHQRALVLREEISKNSLISDIFFHWRQLWCLKIIKCCNLCFLCWVQIKCSCLFFQISAVNTHLKISSNTGVQIYSERFLLSGYCTCDWHLLDFIFSEDNVKKRWILISNLICNNHPFQMIFFLNYLFKQSKLTHKKQNIVLPDIYLILIWKRKG